MLILIKFSSIFGRLHFTKVFTYIATWAFISFYSVIFSVNLMDGDGGITTNNK